MLAIRRSEQRGHANHGWLDSYHTFSFAGYHDPAEMGISNLRVINEDVIAPSAGFAEHGHSDMEIVTYVMEGELEHRDSMGNGSVIRPGDVQRMSAGSGVTHSEYNHTDDQPVHLLQIWLKPNAYGVEPGYEQKHFPLEDRQDRWVLLVSPDGHDGSIAAHQDALLFSSVLSEDKSLDYAFAPGRTGYLHLARGRVQVGEVQLRAGDGLKIRKHNQLQLLGLETAEILLFDLP